MPKSLPAVALIALALIAVCAAAPLSAAELAAGDVSTEAAPNEAPSSTAELPGLTALDGALFVGSQYCSVIHGNSCRQEGATQPCENALGLWQTCECQGGSWNCFL